VVFRLLTGGGGGEFLTLEVDGVAAVQPEAPKAAVQSSISTPAAAVTCIAPEVGKSIPTILNFNNPVSTSSAPVKTANFGTFGASQNEGAPKSETPKVAPFSFTAPISAAAPAASVSVSTTNLFASLNPVATSVTTPAANLFGQPAKGVGNPIAALQPASQANAGGTLFGQLSANQLTTSKPATSATPSIFGSGSLGVGHSPLYLSISSDVGDGTSSVHVLQPFPVDILVA